MERIGIHVDRLMERINNFKPRPSEESLARKCANCGEVVKFSPGQYKRPCPKCKMNIKIRAVVKAPGQEISCWCCLDNGVVIYKEQVEQQIASFAARCLCKKGDRFPTFPLITSIYDMPLLEKLAEKHKNEIMPQWVNQVDKQVDWNDHKKAGYR